MKVEMVQTKGADVTARIVVRLARWKPNVEVLVVIGHEWNSGLAVTDLVSTSLPVLARKPVSRHVCSNVELSHDSHLGQARTALFSQALEPAADATLLIFQPTQPLDGESPFFGFNVKGRRARLGRLSCRWVSDRTT